MAKELKVSFLTVDKSYRWLRARGVVSTKRGVGVKVALSLDPSGDQARLRMLNTIRQSSSRYLSCGLPESLDEPWSGLRPCTPDGLPVISFAPKVRNLIVAGGHAMLGVSLGPIAQKLAAHLVCDEPPDLDMSALSLSRFD